MYEKVAATKGFFKKDFMAKCKLTEKSKPHEFVDVFLPFGKNTVKTNGGGTKEMLSIELMTQWTNAKAIMNGGGDSTYKDFRPFTRVEIRRHIGLYILQGLAPSPQVEFKFTSH